MDAMRLKWHRTPGPIAFVYYSWYLFCRRGPPAGMGVESLRCFMERQNRYVYCIIYDNKASGKKKYAAPGLVPALFPSFAAYCQAFGKMV